jgi:hypothetical protein
MVDLDKDNDPKTKAGYWELKGTPKPYNRSEYAMAKIEGRPPGHGTDASETTETDEIEQKLKDSGFTVSDDECKCGPKSKNLCVVLYFDKGDVKKQDREPFHVAVYDTEFGDWGGKTSAGAPTRRFKNVEDHPHNTDENAKTAT